jgi:Lrp/AsnC family transcriptional regulator for asnA, asnC and gidA
MGKIDELDMKILTELVRDSSLSVPKLSRKIGINPSVAYSRIKRLIRRGYINRFTIEVNEELLGLHVSAIVGLNIDSTRRSGILEQILALDEVREVSEVTGRFDLIVRLKAQSLDKLHELIAGKIGQIEGVQHTETFIEMNKKHREPTFTLPPQQ